ncbi:SH3 domain-containing protein [Streptomyces sp. NPDC005017]|uniref:SH3 domain-containing protein n=1 Tax=Streptomyces sp. NPDC005017 TaxID=3364706 RepID=UPI0036C31F59
MSLRSRLVISLTAAALAATAAATPAVAKDDPGGNGNSSQSGNASQNGNWNQGGNANQNGNWNQGGNANQNGNASQSGNSSQNGNWNQGGNANGNWNQGGQSTQPQSGQTTQSTSTPLYKGVVTASLLYLRSAPNRGGQIIRTVRQGQIVSIYCKTTGETVDGNSLWYLLTDGTWAWGSARYINNIGPAPRWC